MNIEIIKSEQMNRDSLDEIKDEPTKIKENENEKESNEIMIQTIILEEDIEQKRKKEIEKAKKESCCYRWCNCNDQKEDTTSDDCGDNCFWYWYWYLYFNNDNNDNCCDENNDWCECNCCKDCKCNCDCDCDCDCA
jgi:hypothetical protein